MSLTYLSPSTGYANVELLTHKPYKESRTGQHN